MTDDTRQSRAAGEARSLLAIAAPLSAAYLAELAMFITTKIVVGRLGYLELAAVGLAGEITFEIMVVLMGALSVVGVLVAQGLAGGHDARAGHAARQGLLVAAVVALPTTVLVWGLTTVLAVTGQDERVMELSAPYLHALSGSVFPLLCFTVLRGYVAALARTAVVMVITLCAVGLNYLLTVGLVHGRFGLPALGVPGAGWATTLVSWLMLLALVAYVLLAPALSGHRLFYLPARLDRGLCAEIARLGVPVAGLVLLESGLFAAVAILSGILGAQTLAAYQVLMSWIGIPFLIALGLAEGTMVRVAYGAGRGDLAGARRAGFVGIGIAIAVLTLLLVVPLGLPRWLLSVFLDAADPAYGEIEALVVPLLMIVAVFQVFDGLQAVASRALRGLRDTVAPLWIAGFGYWVLGIGGGWVLAFPLGLAAAGLWWGMAAGLIVTGCLLSWRFARLTRARA